MSTLKALIEGYEEVNYPRVTRNITAYEQTAAITEREVTRWLEEYRALDKIDQHARLLRDYIDQALRRYHGYAIEGHIGAHYRQKGMDIALCDFEHVLPQKIVRDLLIQDRITVKQAMNPPTCFIHKDLHRELKEAGWASKTPSAWNFWLRYTQVFDAEYETHNGQVIDVTQWDLGRHFAHFGV